MPPKTDEEIRTLLEANTVRINIRNSLSITANGERIATTEVRTVMGFIIGAKDGTVYVLANKEDLSIADDAWVRRTADVHTGNATYYKAHLLHLPGTKPYRLLMVRTRGEDEFVPVEIKPIERVEGDILHTYLWRSEKGVFDHVRFRYGGLRTFALPPPPRPQRKASICYTAKRTVTYLQKQFSSTNLATIPSGSSSATLGPVTSARAAEADVLIANAVVVPKPAAPPVPFTYEPTMSGAPVLDAEGRYVGMLGDSWRSEHVRMLEPLISDFVCPRVAALDVVAKWKEETLGKGKKPALNVEVKFPSSSFSTARADEIPLPARPSSSNLSKNEDRA